MTTRILRQLVIAWLTVGFASGTEIQRPFTLEQILSAPFPSDLTAAPKGGKIAWVLNARGARNIWVAEPPDYKGRQITATTEDDGQDVGELAWTPDAEAIVYTRGGDLEYPAKDYPNPLSVPQGAEQGVWMVSLGGGQPRKLGEGHSASVSPKGDSVAFVSKGQIWLAPMGQVEAGRAGSDGKAAQLIHARGDATSLRWSPDGTDGTKLAFVSHRADHSFIGVYDFSSKSLRYLDPSVDRDGEPVWSPDSQQIAFIRLPASAETFSFGPRRAGPPWSIRIADARSGAGREVWRAEQGRGSVFRGVVSEHQLAWAAGDRLIFPWERDGWLHLYSISKEGGQAALLTPGNFEVEHVSLGPAGREILFSSNQDDSERRHIWKVPVTGSRPANLTPGTDIAWSPVSTSDGRGMAVLHSTARRPAHAAILLPSGERDLAPETIPSDFPAKELVTPQPVVFSGTDGVEIHGQLFLPANLAPGERRPAVVFFHGGSRRQMLLGWHYMDYYHNAYALNQYLASRRFVVLSVNYRSGIGYGADFREALNYGARGASEFNDALGAGVYLRGRPEVDPKRIGAWGGSYGGYLTALALARASDLFAAGVDFHGVHDWNLEIADRAPAYDPEADHNAARVAFESSPLASVKTWRSPVLLIQGDDDRSVAFAQTVRLAEALRKQGVEFEQLVLPDEIHGFLTHRRWVEAYRAAADFLERHLAPR